VSGAEIRVVDLAAAFGGFADHWSPRIAGDVNDCQVRLAKLLGEFVWHRHDAEDELFLVVKGRLRMRFRDRDDALVGPGQFLIVPRGVEHLPVAEEEVHVVLVEPRSTLHTGDVVAERAVREFARI
jgi:mannose-6-phosphate isomerase-like protein (cupin superfamily)